jgi:hypothetical protein
LKPNIRLFQASQASLSASLRAAAARSAECRIAEPNRYSRDFVVMAHQTAPAQVWQMLKLWGQTPPSTYRVSALWTALGLPSGLSLIRPLPPQREQGFGGAIFSPSRTARITYSAPVP